MNYSTTLPPGFTTWNELWNDAKVKILDDIIEHEYCVFYEIEAGNLTPYNVFFIKARAYDEIMELAGKTKNWNQYTHSPRSREHGFCDEFGKLTHTNIFK